MSQQCHQLILYLINGNAGHLEFRISLSRVLKNVTTKRKKRKKEEEEDEKRKENGPTVK